MFVETKVEGVALKKQIGISSVVIEKSEQNNKVFFSPEGAKLWERTL